MKKACFILIIIFLFSTIFVVITRVKGEDGAPPGMEIIQIGDVKHIVPKGTKIRKDGGVVTLEGHNEYTARKFADVEERLTKIEEEIKGLKTTLGDTDSEKIN